MFRLEEIQTNFCSSRCGTVYFRDLSFEITERKLLSFKRHFLELFSYLFFLILLFLKTKIPVFDKIYLAGYKPFQKDPVPMFRPETHLKSIEFRDSLPPANPYEKVESWRNFSLPLSLHSRENPLSRFQKNFRSGGMVGNLVVYGFSLEESIVDSKAQTPGHTRSSSEYKTFKAIGSFFPTFNPRRLTTFRNSRQIS